MDTSFDQCRRDSLLRKANGERSTRRRSEEELRRFLVSGVAGIAAAAMPLTASKTAKAAVPDGTPEQIHLTWGEDPTRSVVVSWASAAAAANPHVTYGESASHGRV